MSTHMFYRCQQGSESIVLVQHAAAMGSARANNVTCSGSVFCRESLLHIKNPSEVHQFIANFEKTISDDHISWNICSIPFLTISQNPY